MYKLSPSILAADILNLKDDVKKGPIKENEMCD